MLDANWWYFLLIFIVDADDFDDCLSECVDRNGRVDDINSQSNSKTSRRSRNVSGMHASQFHHNNPFVFKCELNVFQKISVSDDRFSDHTQKFRIGKIVAIFLCETNRYREQLDSATRKALHLFSSSVGNFSNSFTSLTGGTIRAEVNGDFGRGRSRQKEKEREREAKRGGGGEVKRGGDRQWIIKPTSKRSYQNGVSMRSNQHSTCLSSNSIKICR